MGEIDEAMETRSNLEMALHLAKVEARKFPKDEVLKGVVATLEELANKAEARYLDALLRVPVSREA